MPDESATGAENLLLGGALRLRQLSKGHRAGTDAILLAAAAVPPPSGTIIDLGSGVGTVGLILGQRSAAAQIVLVEREPDLVDLARANAGLNGMSGRTTVIQADVAAPHRELAALGLHERMADLVVCNPPFLASGRGRSSPERLRREAHVVPANAGDPRDLALDVWIGCARRLLKPRGRLVLIHRGDALPAVLKALATGFGGVLIRPIYPSVGVPAIRVIVSGVSQGRAATAILPGLVLHAEDGSFTPLVEAIHRGAADLV